MDRADSLSKNTNNAKFSPAKRKSIYVLKTDGDDKERKHHRSDAEFEEKLLNCSISATQNSLNSSFADQSKLPVNFEDNFNACLQMFITNKINAQNAWNLNIFEYIKSLVESKSEAQYILQMASTSLDIGAKIYGLRVDDIYDNVLKLANTLSGLHMNEPESEEFDETDTLMEQPIKNKLKRKLNKENSKKTFVVEHEEAINGLIQKNNALDNPASDTTDSSRLFNVLSPKNPNHSFDLLIESKSKTYNWINKTSQKTDIGQCKKVNLELENLPTCKICPSLSDFIIGEDNLKMEENMDKNTFSEIPDDNKPLVPQFDPELDASYMDANGGNGTQNEEEISDLLQRSIGKMYITNMRPTDGQANLEYMYRPLPNVSNHYYVPGIWTGPSHWKLKWLRHPEVSKPKKENIEVTKSTAPRRYKNKPVAYENLSCESIKEILLKASQSKKKTHHNTCTTLIKLCTLPEYENIENEEIMSLMNCPSKTVAIRRHTPNKKDLNISQYEYQNPNDSEFCNTICENGDWDRDDLEINQEGAMENIENQMTFDVNTKILSDQSEYPCENVPFKIAYAQKAKKVDMKQLKSAMWSEICKDQEKVKIIEENNDIKEGEKIKKIQKDGDILLSQVYKDLHKILPATMSENLSPALSFVSLLHLANEHSLVLESKGLSDIIIKKS